MTKKTKNNEAAENRINPKMSPIMDKLGEILGITFKTVHAAPKSKALKTRQIIKDPIKRTLKANKLNSKAINKRSKQVKGK
jgi:hypothetical protein